MFKVNGNIIDIFETIPNELTTHRDRIATHLSFNKEFCIQFEFLIAAFNDGDGEASIIKIPQGIRPFFRFALRTELGKLLYFWF